VGLQRLRREVTFDHGARRSTAAARIQSLGAVRAVHRPAEAHGGEEGPSVSHINRRKAFQVGTPEGTASLYNGQLGRPVSLR
jgi:hypothetical protein